VCDFHVFFFSLIIYYIMKRLVLLILLAIGFLASTSHAQWTEIPALPAALNWPMTTEFNGTFYLFGGVDGSNVASKSIYTYTPGDAAWKKLSVTSPKAKFGGYAAAANGKIYIVGGMVVSGTSYITDNTTYEFDPVANTFATKKNIPIKIGFFAGAAVSGKIYVINGSTSPFTTGAGDNLVQIYDPSADAWVSAGTTPSFNNRLSASAVLNGNIYVMGGLNDDGTFSSDVWKGVPSATDITWAQVSSLPDALMQVSGGAAGGKLVFTGGTNNTPPPNYCTTYVYDETADSWTTSYALPVATFNAGQMFGTGNDLYFAGGYLNSRVFKFTVSNVQQPTAALTLSDIFVNLSQNDTRDLPNTVENFGVAPLTVSIVIPDSAKSWLSATPPGSIDPLGSDSYTIHVTSGTLASGLYKATATINSNDPSHTNLPLNISLYVLPKTVTPQATVVVLEEGTGNWCGYCPQGAEVAQSIKDNLGDSFIEFAYHGGSSSEPMMISAGQNLINDLGIQGYPNAAIQRWFFPNEPYQMTNRGAWPQYAQNVLDQTPNAPVAITVTSYSFDPSTKKVHAVVDLQRSFAMVNDPNSSIHLTTVVTEDGLAGQQEDYRLPSPYWTAYVWNDIVRQMYPNEFGTKVTFPTPTLIDGNIIVPGDKVDITVDLTVPSTIKTDSLKNCNITFIANAISGTSTFGSILQAQRMPLLQGVNAVNSNVANNFRLDQNYPNPVSSETKIGYSLSERTPVTLNVIDVLGREVAHLVSATQDAGNYSVNFDASKLSAGAYIYTLNAGGKTIEKNMTVTK
jgi:N-acetylneuraminic acid mutarotase